MASLTFIVPARNAAETIDQALGSIVAQRLDAYEVICVDDQSTDDTLARMRTWADRHPGHFQILSSASFSEEDLRTAEALTPEGTMPTAHEVGEDEIDLAVSRAVDAHATSATGLAARRSFNVLDDPAGDVRDPARIHGPVRAADSAACGEITVCSGAPAPIGAGICRNVALARATGDYVCFLDADDWLSAPPHSVADALMCAERADADVLIWDLWYYNDHLKRDQYPYVGTLNFGPWCAPGDASGCSEVFDVHRAPDWAFLSFQNWLWNKLFRREFLQGNGLGCTPLHRTEDLRPTCLALVLAPRICLYWHRVSHYRILQPRLSSLNSVYRHPLDFACAFIQLKRELMERGMFDELRRSYVTWAVQSLAINVDFLRPYVLYEQVFERLNGALLDEMGIGDVSPDDLVLPGEFEKYRQLRTLSAGDYLVEVHARHYRYLMERDGEVFALREELASCCDELAVARGDLEEARVALECERFRAEQAEAEIREVRSSHSYRLGNAVMAPLASLRDRFGKL